MLHDLYDVIGLLRLYERDILVFVHYCRTTAVQRHINIAYTLQNITIKFCINN